MTSHHDVTEHDLDVGGGRMLHAYDTGRSGGDDLVVVWHHGTPNVGSPPAPLFPAAAELGIRFVSYDRPGYGGSTPVPDRDVASAADDVAVVADALAVERFAVLGHSGGGSHALACAARLADRVLAAASVSGMAPFGAAGLDWFAGMSPVAAASLRAAAGGRDAKERHEAEADDGDPGFVPADHDALAGEWSWFMDVVRPALADGPAPLVDDDLAYVHPWGFDPATIVRPVLLLHGDDDRVIPVTHAEWLAAHIPGAELRRSPGDGHLSVMRHGPAALEWLADTAR